MLATEKPRKTAPEAVFSSSIQEPFSENGPGWVYLAPTAGMLRGLVSCQTARPSMVTSMREMPILALAPIDSWAMNMGWFHGMRYFSYSYKVTSNRYTLRARAFSLGSFQITLGALA